MTPEQLTAAVRYLGEGATFSETWAMIGASRRDAELAWTTGKRDAENGVESELSSFFREAAAARSRLRATLRSEAREAAGSRAATDALALLAALQSEEEPSAIASSDDVRATSPILSLVDKIEAEEDLVERARLQAVQRNASLALHELFYEMTKPREREEAVA